MKILVYGAGVIGSYVTHILCENGHDVALAARGRWKENLEKNGLVIRHALQLKTTVDHPGLADAARTAEAYDVVFAVMQYQQMWQLADTLALLDTPVLVLVGNNMKVSELEAYILERSPGPKRIIFGFSGTAGHRDAERVVCARFGTAHLTCGPAQGTPDEGMKKLLDGIFTGKYRAVYQQDMDVWCKCHAAFVLPIAFGCYIHDCELKKVTGQERGLCLDAAGEACRVLRRLGYPVDPQEELYYQRGTKQRRSMELLLFVMAKTFVGKLAASDHCRAAAKEMHGMAGDFQKLCDKAPEESMKAWNTLTGRMAPWEELEKRFSR